MNKNDNKTNPCIDIILLKRIDYKKNMNENKKKAKISKIIECLNKHLINLQKVIDINT